MHVNLTWSHLLKLTDEAQYTQQVQTGHWLWIYDNLNLHQVVRHEREGMIWVLTMQIHNSDKHSSMLNVTARLAVKIINLPDWTVDWNDNTPQCSRSSFDCSNFLPSIEDADALNEAHHGI